MVLCLLLVLKFERLGISRRGLQILIFFDTNKEIYCHLNMTHLATRNYHSTYTPIEGRKTGSRPFR